MGAASRETTRALRTLGILAVTMIGCGRSSPTISPPSAAPAPAHAAASTPAAPSQPRPAAPTSSDAAPSLAAPEPAPPEPTRADSLELTFVGDVIFGRYRADGFEPIAPDGLEVFAEVHALLDSHLVVGNLETPLVHQLPATNPIPSPHRFGASASMARALARARFDALSLANNHAYDLRRAGLEQTPQILQELGIVGLGSVPPTPPTLRVQTIERAGWRIGFVAVATRLNGPRPRGLPSIPLVPPLELVARVGPLVEQARADHDLLVLLVHWGEEHRPTPTAAQRRVAHRLVDAGVDLIVGHHPHVLQGIEPYGDGLIAYSLGNFLFDDPRPTPRQTGILRVRVRGGGCLDAVIVHPVFIDDTPAPHPTPATGERGEAIKQRLRALSGRWGAHFVDDGDSLVLDAPGCSPEPADAVDADTVTQDAVTQDAVTQDAVAQDAAEISTGSSRKKE